jgi:MoxR-like ATPase
MNYDICKIKQQFAQQGYIADEELATTLGLMQSLERPLLVEGEAGVGKTEIAKALAGVMDSLLIRLQCFDGLDTNAAVYEWNYTRQLISIKLHEASNQRTDIDVFSEEFLMERPLLQSIRQEQSAVLLVDEIDRADEAFEAYLLELLSDFQISIPELGTIKAKSKPRVVLTSNGTRELSDALRRRCLYHYIDYPDKRKELAIINSRLPGIQQKLAGQIVSFVQQLRQLELLKPGDKGFSFRVNLLSVG